MATVLATNQMSYSSASALLNASATSITRINATCCNVAISWRIEKKSTTSYNENKYFHLVTSGTGSSSVVRGASAAIPQLSQSTSGSTVLNGTSYITLNGLNKSSTVLRCGIGISKSATNMSASGTLVFNGTNNVSSSTYSPAYQYNNLSFSNYTYSVNVSANNSSYINSVSGNATNVTVGTATSINCTLNSTTGYTFTFVNWSYSNGTQFSTSQNTSISGAAGKSYSLIAYATRSTNSYTLNLSSANTSRVTVSGGGTKSYKTNVSAVATLKSITGYTVSFLGWYEGSTKVNSSLNYTFEMPASNKTLVANASATVNSYTATIQSTNTTRGTVSGGGSKNYGTSVTATATPKTGYSFVNWSGTYSSTNNPYTFTMPASAVTLNATFSVNSYTLTLANNSVNYISSVTGNGSKSYGASVTVTAVLNNVTGYTTTFTQWTSNNTTLLNSSPNNPYTFTMPAGNIKLTATASRTANQYTTTFNNTTAIRFDTQSNIVANATTANTINSPVFSLNTTSTVQTYDSTSNVPSCTLNQSGLKFDSYWTYTNVNNSYKLVTKMPSTWNLTTNDSEFIAVLYGSQRTFTKLSGVNKYDGTLKYQLVNNSWQIVS